MLESAIFYKALSWRRWRQKHFRELLYSDKPEAEMGYKQSRVKWCNWNKRSAGRKKNV